MKISISSGMNYPREININFDSELKMLEGMLSRLITKWVKELECGGEE